MVNSEELLDLPTAINLENDLPPGIWDVKFYTTRPFTAEEINEIKATLADEGVEVKNISQGVFQGTDYLSVIYERRAAAPGISFLPAAIIPLIGFGLVSVLVGIGIFKVGDILASAAKLIAITGGIVLVAIVLLRKPIEKFAEKKI
jgi:hypothetical protein